MTCLTMKPPDKRYGPPEISWTPCPGCGFRDLFTAVAPPGEREQPLYLCCCDCGRERDDLVDFYGDSPA